MGPIFNPVNWVVGVFILFVAMVLAIVLSIVFYSLIKKPKTTVVKTSVNSNGSNDLHGTQILETKNQTPKKLFSTATFFVIIFLVSFCGLCNWIFSDPYIPKRMPKQEDVVGTWHVTSGSLEFMREKGGYEISTHKIILNG